MEHCLSGGINVVLVLDADGRRQLAVQYPRQTVGIFLLPPSAEALQERLTLRDRDESEERRRRMAVADAEMERAREYDHVLINHHLGQTLELLRRIVRTHRSTTEAASAQGRSANADSQTALRGGSSGR